MDIQDIGAGAGAGSLIGAVLTYFGFKQRVDRLQIEVDNLSNKIVWRDTCYATQKRVDDRLDAMDKKLDLILDKITNGK